jgi:hypothetical protein
MAAIVHNFQRAIKLICNRVIHESVIVCRYLNSTLYKHRLDLDISIAKDIQIEING